MATSSSATDQDRQPLEAPFLRQPPPIAKELPGCEEPIGPLKDILRPALNQQQVRQRWGLRLYDRKAVSLQR
jgi:hypothetical protein